MQPPMLRNLYLFLLYISTYSFVTTDASQLKDEGDPTLPVPPPIKVNNKTFFIETFFRANWYKAGEFCRFHGMNLASISNQEENDKLRETLERFGLNNDQYQFWTSGNDLGSSFSYVWQSSGSSFLFSSWVSTEPNHAVSELGNETQHCVFVFSFTSEGWWHDGFCSAPLYFICEL